MPDCPSAEQILGLVAGRSIEPAIEEHIKGCADCWRQVAEFRTLAVLAASRSGLGPADGSITSAGAAERVFAQVKPYVVAALLDHAIQATARFPIAVGNRQQALFEFDETLVQALREALDQPPETRSQAIAGTIRQHDGLCLIAAGEESGAVITSPLWFTHFVAPPERLSWSAAVDQPPSNTTWCVRISNLKTGQIFVQETSTASLDVPVDIGRNLPVGGDIEWDVRQAHDDPQGPTLVRGVFRLLAKNDVANLEACREKSQIEEDGPSRDLAQSRCYYAAGLWDDLRRHLLGLLDKYPSGTMAFLVRRGLAAVFTAVPNELTGPRMRGDPEGIWALANAQEYLTQAYRAVSIDFSP